jgi:hypothetical protein
MNASRNELKKRQGRRPLQQQLPQPPPVQLPQSSHGSHRGGSSAYAPRYLSPQPEQPKFRHCERHMQPVAAAVTTANPTINTNRFMETPAAQGDARRTDGVA